MSKRAYFLLFFLGVVVNLLVAWLQVVPGYMDAEYYYSGGWQVAQGKGLNEPFLWNYLDDPAGLPHPAFTYWMPMPSLLAAAGMLVTGRADFLSARLFFILLAGAIVPLTAYFTLQLTQRLNYAWLAGLLAVFGGFYPLYLGNIESFSIYMVSGTLFLILSVYRGGALALRKYLPLGLVAGLMHLSRADGILWLVAALGIAIYDGCRVRNKARLGNLRPFFPVVLILSAYLAVMGAWYWRNCFLYGSLFSPAGSRAVWLTNYNDTFLYPAGQLTFSRWVDNGLIWLLTDRLKAFSDNLKTVLAVEGEVFLLPLAAVGLWEFRKDCRVCLGAGMWLVTIIVMSFVFPYAGARGGMLHSGAAFQPLIWATAPVGLNRILLWVGRRRGWFIPQAMQVFGIGLVILSAGLTVFIVANRVIGNQPEKPVWSESYRRYVRVGETLDELGVPSQEVSLVNNPPGLFTATRRPSVVIPEGDLAAVFATAKTYDATYLILEENTTVEMSKYYRNPGSVPGLFFLGGGDDYQIYRIELDP